MSGNNPDPLPGTQQSDAVSRPLAAFKFEQPSGKKEGAVMLTERGDIAVVIDRIVFRLPLQEIVDWGIKQWRAKTRPGVSTEARALPGPRPSQGDAFLGGDSRPVHAGPPLDE